MIALKDTCNEVQKTMAAMENKIISFEKTIRELKKNVTNANFTKKNQVVIEQHHAKNQQSNSHRKTKQTVNIMNADTSIPRKSRISEKASMNTSHQKTDQRLPQQTKSSALGEQQQTGLDRYP